MSSVADAEPFFNPTSISGCRLWFDASDPNGNGILPANNSSITSWRDKSGNNNHTTAVSGTVLFSRSGINSRGSIVFNNSYFTGALTTTFTGSPVYSFVVASFNSTTVSFSRILSLGRPGVSDANQSTTCIPFLRNSGAAQLYAVANNVGSSFQAITYGSPFISASFFNGTAVGININGQLTVNTNVTTSFNLTSYGIGKSTDTNDSSQYMGEICEIISYFGTTLTLAQQQQIEGYLAWKWGLQSILGPYGTDPHPYRTSIIPPLLNPPTTAPTFTENDFFNPTQISGCQIWIDATDVSRITFSGSNVTSIRDKTTNQYLFSNVTGFGYTNAGFNNRPAFINDSYIAGRHLGSNSSISFNQPTTFFAVGRKNDPASEGYICDTADAGGANRNAIIGKAASGLVSIFAGAELFSSSVGLTANYIGSFLFNTTNSFIYMNGSQQANGNAGTQNLISGLLLGNRFSFNAPYTGFFCEFIMYNVNLTLAQVQQVEGYLAWKWGLQANLPASHPYRSSVIAPLLNPSTLPAQIISAFWTPRSIPNCILWFDAADTSTITTSGTTVTSWLNKGTLSGSATTAIPSPRTEPTGTVSSGNRGYVTFNTTRLNCVFFPGSSYLGILSVTTTQKTRVQAFIFSVTAFGDGYSRILCSANLGVATHQIGFNAWNRDTNTINTYPETLASELLNIVGQAPYSGTLPYNGTPFIIVWQHSTSVTENYMSVNGIRLNPANNNALVNGYFTGTNNFLLGCGPGFTNAQIVGEVIQYDGGLSTIQLAQLEGYLAWKWGLVGNLPTNHPFKLYPPPPA